MDQKTVYIKNERIKNIIRNKHPYIFSGAVSDVRGNPEQGDIVSVADSTDKIVAYGTYNPASDIRVRIISWNTDEKIDENWFKNKIKSVSESKELLLGINSFSGNKKNYRVIYSESDSIPGLIIDRYGNVFVIQLQTFFADRNRDIWIKIIKDLWTPKLIYERSDIEVRKKEGLNNFPTGILYGELPEKVIIEEDGFKIIVDIVNGQKTGYYLDLRQTRRKIEYWCNRLHIKYLQNCFGYTGSFNLYCARAGVTRIEHIDCSQSANDLAKENAINNGYEKNIHIFTMDVFKFLTPVKDNSVDAIILDPPAFVKHKDKLKNAIEGYERLNTIAMKKLKKGGILFTLCCSNFVDEKLFQEILYRAGSIANCNMKVLEKLGHDFDHTLILNFPEARYLQSWILIKT
jgi:23S rRNA (cytosine1962-C5)-methyltransferase